MRTEIEYSSIEAKLKWNKKIKEARILDRLEQDSVKYGLRRCGLRFGVAPDELDMTISRFLQEGLVLKPIDRMAVKQQAFSHLTRRSDNDTAFSFKCVIARTEEEADQFNTAQRDRDNEHIGEMLGYPRCCCRFFQIVWDYGCFDPIWQTADNTSAKVSRKGVCRDSDGKVIERCITLTADSGAWLTSSCLRYIGIRIISHFACSATCVDSIGIANQRIELARHIGIRGIEAALEVLRLPCRWECRNGVALVSTPVFQFRIPSMAYEVRHVVQTEGFI